MFAKLIDLLVSVSVVALPTKVSVAAGRVNEFVPATAAARDNNGTSNGLGVIAAIYVSTATTNAGAVTNTTISYTNQDGVPGKTGTIPSFPATATAGSMVFVNLAAGDSGVRSVESVTLGTSYGGGAIHLVLVRPIVIGPVTTSNIGYCSSISDYKSVKILPNARSEIGGLGFISCRDAFSTRSFLLSGP